MRTLSGVVPYDIQRMCAEKESLFFKLNLPDFIIIASGRGKFSVKKVSQGAMHLLVFSLNSLKSSPQKNRGR